MQKCAVAKFPCSDHFVKQRYLENASSTHDRHFTTKLMLITARSYRPLSVFIAPNFTSRSQHCPAHFQMLYACAHVVLFLSQTLRSWVWELVHTWNRAQRKGGTYVQRVAGPSSGSSWFMALPPISIIMTSIVWKCPLTNTIHWQSSENLWGSFANALQSCSKELSRFIQAGDSLTDVSGHYQHGL